MYKKIRFFIYRVILYSFLVYSFFPYSYIDPEVTPFLNDFRVKMWDNCNAGKINSTWQTSIKIVDKIPFANKDVIGQCMRKPFGFDILLSRNFWNLTDDSSRRQLVYHELFHCYLYLHHTPGSLMGEYHIPYSQLEVERQLDYFINKACKE